MVNAPNAGEGFSFQEVEWFREPMRHLSDTNHTVELHYKDGTKRTVVITYEQFLELQKRAPRR